MGNCNNCLVPSNDRNNQYLMRNYKCMFSADNFDENYAEGRITRREVQEVLDNIHDVCPEYTKMWKYHLCFILIIVFLEFLLFLGIFMACGDETEYCDGFLPIMIIWLVALFACLITYIIVIIIFQRKIRSKI